MSYEFIMVIIVPGINTTDEVEYEKMLRMAEGVCDLIQIDIGDGEFTLKKSLGPETIKKYPSSKNLEIQLMVFDPLTYVDQLVLLPFVSKILFPLESRDDHLKVIGVIKSGQRQVGMSLNPETAVLQLEPYAGKIDYIQLLANRPGPSGQLLREETYGRIRQVKKIYPSLPVEIDIGVNLERAPKLAAAGADFLVSTSAIYGAEDFNLAYQELAKAANQKHNKIYG